MLPSWNLENLSVLIHFMPLISFDTPEKHPKTRGFLMFSGGIKRDQSSNIDEVIRSVWNFLIFFTKRFHKYKKAQNSLQQTKIKNVYKKHLSHQDDLVF